MDDPYKEELVAKAASNSLEALDLIMQTVKSDINAMARPDYQSFLRMLHDPKYAHIKEILDKTKADIVKNDLDRKKLKEEILKQRDDLKK